MSYNRWNYYSLAYARTYSFWAPTYSMELYHHGVKGMKWGVRRERNQLVRRTKRDLNMLADNLYQKEKDNLRSKRDHGADKDYIKSEKQRIKSEYKQHKQMIKSETKAAKKSSSVEEARAKFQKVRNQAMSDIPNYKLKRGLRTANTLLNGLRTGALAVTSGMVVAGAVACGVTSGAAAGLATGGVLAIPLAVGAGKMAADAAIRRKLIKEFG